MVLVAAGKHERLRTESGGGFRVEHFVLAEKRLLRCCSRVEAAAAHVESGGGGAILCPLSAVHHSRVALLAALDRGPDDGAFCRLGSVIRAFAKSARR